MTSWFYWLKTNGSNWHIFTVQIAVSMTLKPYGTGGLLQKLRNTSTLCTCTNIRTQPKVLCLACTACELLHNKFIFLGYLWLNNTLLCAILDLYNARNAWPRIAVVWCVILAWDMILCLTGHRWAYRKDQTRRKYLQCLSPRVHVSQQPFSKHLRVIDYIQFLI